MLLRASVLKQPASLLQPLRLLVKISRSEGFDGHNSARFAASAASPEPAPADEAREVLRFEDIPALPRWPLLGSMPAFAKLEKQHPPMKIVHHTDKLFYLLYKEKGEIFTIGMPGLGSGISGTCVATSNPEEFLKVIRTEGAHPYGAIQDQWPTIAALQAMGSKVTGFFESGEEWSRFRKVIQKGMMPPLTAKGYLPNISKACESASSGAAAHGSDIASFSTRCSFDIFCSMMFGQFTATANPAVPADPRHEAFCQHVMAANEHIMPMMASPYEYTSNVLLGIRTSRARAVLSHFREQLAYSNQFMDAFLEKWGAGKLDSYEAKSYLAVCMTLAAQSQLTAMEMKEMNQLLLTAAVDTTSAMLTWAILQLAINRDAQERLAAELQRELRGGAIQEAMTGRAFLPYLHAVIRESHRMRPVLPISLFKHTMQELSICGFNIPKGTPIMLDQFSPQNDPQLVPNPERFQPEHWLPEEVESRVGTPSQVIDHPLLKGPFSAGARMCPGSRVAQLEVLAMLARLVQDWQFEVADPAVRSIADVDYYRGLTVMPCKPVPAVLFKPRT